MDENGCDGAQARGTTGQRGNASEGTQEREERITGSVGVQNLKGETIDQGSTTSPKGGAGRGEADQGRVESSYLGGAEGAGTEVPSGGGSATRKRDKEGR